MDDLEQFLSDDSRDDIDNFLDGETDSLAAKAGDELDAFLDEVDPKVFETTLTPAQEQRFQAWKRTYAPNDSGEDYDLRGAFLSGLTGPDENGHWPDTFKKPNHPTFSNESKYAMGEFARPRAGKWDGDIFLEPGRDKATMGEKVGNAAGKAMDAVSNFVAAPVRGAKDTKVFMDAAGWLANENADNLAQSIAEREAAREQRPDYVRQLEEDLQAASDQYRDRPDGIRDTLSAIGQIPGAIIRNPAGTAYTALEQIPNILPSLAGAGTGAAIGSAAGPAGAVVGGVAGMSAGTIATEAGAKVIELLSEQNPQLDLRNPEAVAAALQEPGFREEAARRGLTKGAVIAAIDLLTMGIGGKLATTGTRIFERDLGEALTRMGVDVTDRQAVARAMQDPDFWNTAVPTVGRDGREVWQTPDSNLRPSFDSMASRNRRGIATALGVETLGEGLGEGLGELASGGDPSLKDVAMEMLGSAGMSAAQTAAGALYESGQNQLARGAADARGPGFTPPPSTPPPPEDQFNASADAVDDAAETARQAAQAAQRLLNGPVSGDLPARLPPGAPRPFSPQLLEDGNARLRGSQALPPPASGPNNLPADQRSELDRLRQKRARDREALGLTPDIERGQAEGRITTQAGMPAGTATAAPPAATAVTSEDDLGQMFDDVLAEELAADAARATLVDALDTPPPGQARNTDEDDAIARQRERQRQARERYRLESALDPAKDDILAAIAKLGGWSREEAEAQGIDPANFGRRGWRIKRVFTGQGDTADGLAERLAQYGYPVLDENGNYTANKLLDAVGEALAGNKVGTAAYNEAQAEVRLQQMQDAFLDGETDDPFGEAPPEQAVKDPLADWAAEAAASGQSPFADYDTVFEEGIYEGLETPEEEALFDIAQAAIESGMPADEIEAFIERSAIQGLTNDEIRQALETARSERERVQGRGPAQGNQGAGDPAGAQEFNLQAYDAKDLKNLTQAEKDRAEAARLEAQKAEADEQRGSFTLTGGDRPVDEADARGQQGMFDARGQAAPSGSGLRTTTPTGNGVELLVERYSSGMTRPRDLDAGFKNDAAIGIDVGELSARQVETLGERIAEAQRKTPGFRIFIDSGAFSLFRRSLKQAGNVQPMDWGAIFERYNKILDGVEANGGDVGRVALVMPDVVGNQEQTLKLLTQHAGEIADIAYRGADYIIPYQGGLLSMPYFHAEIAREFSAMSPPVPTWRIGIPSNEAAISNAEMTALTTAQPGWEKWHILGAVRGPKFERRMAVLRRFLEPNGEFSITADANVLRAGMEELKGLSGAELQEKLAELLARKGDAITVERTEPDLVDAVSQPAGRSAPADNIDWQASVFADAVEASERAESTRNGKGKSAERARQEAQEVFRAAASRMVEALGGDDLERLERSYGELAMEIDRAARAGDEGALNRALAIREIFSSEIGRIWRENDAAGRAWKERYGPPQALFESWAGTSPYNQPRFGQKALFEVELDGARIGVEQEARGSIAIHALDDRARFSETGYRSISPMRGPILLGSTPQESALDLIRKTLSKEKKNQPPQSIYEYDPNTGRFERAARAQGAVTTPGTRVAWSTPQEWLDGLDAIERRAISSTRHRQVDDHWKALADNLDVLRKAGPDQRNALIEIRDQVSEKRKRRPEGLDEFTQEILVPITDAAHNRMRALDQQAGTWRDPNKGRRAQRAESEAAEPLKEWQMEIPTEGLPLTDDQLAGKGGAYEGLPGLVASEAVNAITQTQRMNGGRLYAYVLPAAGGRNGRVRLFPDDQTPPAPWQLLSGEGLAHGAMTREQLVSKLREWLRSAPIIGEAPADSPPPQGRRPNATQQTPANAGVSASGPRAVTIKDVPPFIVNRTKVTVKQMWDEGMREAEVPAKEALKDINREIAAMNKLRKCVEGD